LGRKKKQPLPCCAERQRLIAEIASMLPKREVPPEARKAALTLIGWLARRTPTEPPDPTTTGREG
jgi:hypothetical protein